MNRNVLRARYFAGAALAVGLALAGCGGNNTPAGGGDTQAAPLSLSNSARPGVRPEARLPRRAS